MTKTASKSAAKPTSHAASSVSLIVLGYDDQHKPHGARFQGSDVKLVSEAAKAMGLNVYEAANEDLAALAKKLPTGRLYSNGKGFVPNIRQNLYSALIANLAQEPKAALAKDDEAPLPQVSSGLPRSWDEIAPGHLVIAEETLEYGWWRAIVLDRNGDMLTLKFRDYPQLPRFVRHRSAVALVSTALGEPPAPVAA
ncbi:MAG TPA: hypothetical protein VFW23_15475 [Tepidisphaeraceae bacterium]|nr:hypothetical protein [Tepidisphaeraceae bacterium]